MFCNFSVLFVTMHERILSFVSISSRPASFLTRSKASVFFFILVICVFCPVNGHYQHGREADVFHSVPVRPGSPGHTAWVCYEKSFKQ